MNGKNTFPLKILYGNRCPWCKGDLFLPKLSKNGIILKDEKRLCPHCTKSLKIKINNSLFYYLSVFLIGVMPIASITGSLIFLNQLEPSLSKFNETAIIYLSLFFSFSFIFSIIVFLAEKGIVVYEKDNPN